LDARKTGSIIWKKNIIDKKRPKEFYSIRENDEDRRSEFVKSGET
jgi:hypothetical protein